MGKRVESRGGKRQKGDEREERGTVCISYICLKENHADVKINTGTWRETCTEDDLHSQNMHRNIKPKQHKEAKPTCSRRGERRGKERGGVQALKCAIVRSVLADYFVAFAEDDLDFTPTCQSLKALSRF